MNTLPSRHSFARGLMAACVLALGAHVLVACGDMSNTGALARDSDAGVFADAPASPMQCTSSDGCRAHNEICHFSGGGVGMCQSPPDRGRCAPPDPSTVVPGETPGCYPGARCQPVPRDRSMLGGLCSFGAPQAPVFNIGQTVLPKISVTGPGALSVIRPTDGIRLVWTPPALGPDATLVAVILSNVPQRVSGANRIANPRDLVWIWSSTDPGASTTPGNVPLEAGHRGVDANGALGARYESSRLPAGRYWWFVFAQRNGLVVTASDVLSFRVGEDFAAHACATVDQCVRAIPGELADTVSCINRVCRRRCASDLDCPGVGGHCDIDFAQMVADGTPPPRGGYCAIAAP